LRRALVCWTGAWLGVLSGNGLAQSATDPAWLEEHTTIPGTLNDLAPAPGGVSSSAAPPNSPAELPSDSSADTQNGNGPVIPSAADAAPSPEALDALAPVWFAPETAAPAAQPSATDPGVSEPLDQPGSSATPGFDGIDARGPYIIGPVIETPAPDPALTCAAARRDLALLAEAWPVYRDEQGRLRHQWARDPYRGARRYLDADARQAAAAGATQTRDRDCPDAGDPEAAVSARATLLRAALCEAEQAELGALEALPAGAPAADTATLQRKRAVVTEVCTPVQASVTRDLQQPVSARQTRRFWLPNISDSSTRSGRILIG
ncbi:MAG: hypothetical protein ACKOBM_01450, partial [Gammaproteobacteria bacterium]